MANLVTAMLRKAVLILSLLSFFLCSAMTTLAQEAPSELGQDYVEYNESVDSDGGPTDYEDSDDEGLGDDYDDYQAQENITLESGESLPRSEDSKRYHAEIEKVLADEDFAQQETVTRRRLKDVTDKETRDEKFPQWIIDLVKSVESAGEAIAVVATILEVLAWILVIGLVAFLSLKYRTQLRGWVANIGANEVEPELPTSLFGLDIQKESIPDDVVMVAEEHWLKLEKREAVALLLRSGLLKLLHQHNCRFFSSDTEAECCDRIDQQVNNDISRYMRDLVGVWQRLAYAHKDPSEDEFKRLCVQWREVFE